MKELELQEMQQASGGLKALPFRKLSLPVLEYEAGPQANTLPSVEGRRFWLP